MPRKLQFNFNLLSYMLETLSRWDNVTAELLSTKHIIIHGVITAGDKFTIHKDLIAAKDND